MKKHLTNKRMQADIREAKLNIFDRKATKKLKENLDGAWAPNDGLDSKALQQLDKIGLETLIHFEQALAAHKKLSPEELTIENELKALQAQERDRKNEEHQLLNLARYLIEAAALAEITISLKKAIQSKNHKQIKELLNQFKKGLKTLPIRMEEEQQIFKQLETELHPLLLRIEKITAHPHLFTEAQNILQLIEQKQIPPKWKHAA
jgi:hypothetical protein